MSRNGSTRTNVYDPFPASFLHGLGRRGMIDGSGRSEAWYRVRFGSGRSLVRIQSPRPLSCRRNPCQAVVACEDMLHAEVAESAWFDKLTMSAHPEPVEGCEFRAFSC